jgi:hypothetical protein
MLSVTLVFIRNKTLVDVTRAKCKRKLLYLCSSNVSSKFIETVVACFFLLGSAKYIPTSTES